MVQFMLQQAIEMAGKPNVGDDKILKHSCIMQMKRVKVRGPDPVTFYHYLLSSDFKFCIILCRFSANSLA